MSSVRPEAPQVRSAPHTGEAGCRRAGAATSPIVVGLVQITEAMESHVYLPYSLGLLQAYAQAHAPDPSRYLFQLPVCRREPIAGLVPRFSLAQVAAFSTYVWNIRYSLALAAALKTRYPQILIVFGGPQVPDRAQDFMAAHPFIDVCIHGEGERSFLQLLESIEPGQAPDQNALAAIPGLSHRLPDGSIATTPKGERLADLDALPSPYLSGFFEPLMLAHPELKWAAPWETNRGCPFSCTFCDWGSAIAAKVHRFGIERLQAEIAWFGRRRIELIYCCDANFGLLPRDLEIAQALADSKKQSGYPRKAIIQLTKNRPERAFEAMLTLKEAGLHLSSTLSMQSVTPSVLTAIRRDNISSQAYHDLLKRFNGVGMPTYTDMLIGLPGESFDSFLAGIATVIDQGQHEEQRFWNTYILPNAEMADPAYRARYAIETVHLPYLDPYMPPTPPVDGIQESMEMIVATSTMSRTDWMRMRALAWMTQMLYYGRLLQLPLMLIHERTGIGYDELLMAFCEQPLPPGCPVLTQLRAFLHARAQEMTQGQPEYVLSPDPATGKPVWFPVQSFLLTQLVASPKLSEFYREATQVLTTLLARHDKTLPPGLLADSLRLVETLFTANFRHGRPFSLSLNWNLWSAYQHLLKGEAANLQPGTYQLHQAPDGQGGFTMDESPRHALI